MSWTTEHEVISIGSENTLALLGHNCASKVQLLLEPVETKRKTDHSSETVRVKSHGLPTKAFKALLLLTFWNRWSASGEDWTQMI